MLLSLAESEVGCYIGNWLVGVIAYADNTVLSAPSASAMRAMLHTCDTFAEQFNVIFYVRSQDVCFSHQRGVIHVVFTVNTRFTSTEVLLSMHVEEWLHLGTYYFQ